jgi:hypothetical protein
LFFLDRLAKELESGFSIISQKANTANTSYGSGFVIPYRNCFLATAGFQFIKRIIIQKRPHFGRHDDLCSGICRAEERLNALGIKLAFSKLMRIEFSGCRALNIFRRALMAPGFREAHL